MDLVYEYTENGISIFIKAPESPTEVVEAMAVIPPLLSQKRHRGQIRAKIGQSM